jgi:hypothetical protein
MISALLCAISVIAARVSGDGLSIVFSTSGSEGIGLFAYKSGRVTRLCAEPALIATNWNRSALLARTLVGDSTLVVRPGVRALEVNHVTPPASWRPTFWVSDGAVLGISDTGDGDYKSVEIGLDGIPVRSRAHGPYMDTERLPQLLPKWLRQSSVRLRKHLKIARMDELAYLSRTSAFMQGEYALVDIVPRPSFTTDVVPTAKGARWLIIDPDTSIRVFDDNRSRVRLTFKHTIHGSETISDAALTPDGQQVVFILADVNKSPGVPSLRSGNIHVLDLRTSSGRDLGVRATWVRTLRVANARGG